MSNNLESKILKFFLENREKTIEFNTLCKVFRIKGQTRKTLKDVLYNLESKDFIEYKKKNSYKLLPKKSDRGESFDDSRDNKKTVRKDKPVANSARVKLTPEDKKDQKILAIYHEKTYTYLPLLNDLARYSFSCLNDEPENNNLEDGNLVYIRPIVSTRGKIECARFDSVVSHSITGSESLVSILNAEIPLEFPQDVIAETDKLNDGLTKQEYSEREDLTKLPLITIDGEDSRDFDDAVFAEPWIDKQGNDNGGFHIIVAIADVSHYIKEGSKLEKEALKRGNSTYFPDMVVPMLPERLSNDLCSLVPHVDRPVLAAHLYIDANGNLKKHTFKRAVMHSHKRCTYNQVQAALEGNYKHIDEEFTNQVLVPLEQAYEVLQDQRDRRGALDLDTTETYIVFDEETKMVSDIVPRKRFTAHMLIEELMVLANVAAAKALKEYSCMYRIHEEPSAEKVSNLKINLKGLNIRYFFNDDKALTPYDFKKIISKMREVPGSENLMNVILRSQSQARYGSQNLGHFGLALDHYAHFTSPIRRYSDLIVHRLLIKNLSLAGEGGIAYSSKKVDEIAEHISVTERISQKCEWDAKERFVAAYYSERLNEHFNATVVSINKFGMFVKLENTGAEGLVPYKTMKNDFFILDERSNTLRGKRTRKVVKVGTQIKIELRGANVNFGKLSFDFVKFM